MQKGFHLFTFKGIPVYVQFFFIVLVLLLSWGANIAQMLIFAICIVFGILAHEFGHALVARHFGLHPEITLCAWGGLTSHTPTASRKQNFLITLAGPMTGIVIGGIFFGLIQLFANISQLAAILANPYVGTFLLDMMWVNLVWGVFNLLPIHPMDGSKIFGYILTKFTTIEKSEKIIAASSFVIACALMAISVLQKNLFMIIISGYLLLINAGRFFALFKKNNNAAPRLKMAAIQAEALYEKGLVAARNHDWRALEIFGQQMKRESENGDQLKRAYELLTIACTNLGKYDEALSYAPHAKQTDAVKQATIRCSTMTRRRP